MDTYLLSLGNESNLPAAGRSLASRLLLLACLHAGGLGVFARHIFSSRKGAEPQRNCGLKRNNPTIRRGGHHKGEGDFRRKKLIIESSRFAQSGSGRF